MLQRGDLVKAFGKEFYVRDPKLPRRQVLCVTPGGREEVFEDWELDLVRSVDED